MINLRMLNPCAGKIREVGGEIVIVIVRNIE